MPISRSWPTECCVGLVFSSPAALRYGHEREVNVEAVLLADVERELANRFEERQPFDVADGAADFGDHDVDIVGRPACECTLLISLVMCGITCTVLPRNSPRRSFSITER